MGADAATTITAMLTIVVVVFILILIIDEVAIDVIVVSVAVLMLEMSPTCRDMLAMTQRVAPILARWVRVADTKFKMSWQFVSA